MYSIFDKLLGNIIKISPRIDKEDVRISISDAFEIINLQSLRWDSGTNGKYLNEVIDRTLRALNIHDSIDVIVRRHDQGDLLLCGVSSNLNRILPINKRKIPAGELFSFYGKPLSNTNRASCPSNSIYDVQTYGVKFFPLTGYPFYYAIEGAESLNDLVLMDYSKKTDVTDSYIKDHMNEKHPNTNIIPKIDKEVNLGVLIKNDIHNDFCDLKVFGEALKEVNENENIGTPYVVGWSFPLFLQNEDRSIKTWGFVTFYSKDIFKFGNIEISKNIKIIQKFFLDFAQFSYTQELVYGQYESAIGAKRLLDSKSYFLAAKAYERIFSFKLAKENYIKDIKFILSNCDAENNILSKNMDYFDSLCNALLCQARVPGEAYQLEQVKFTKKYFEKIKPSTDSQPEGGANSSDELAFDINKAIFDFVENNISSFNSIDEDIKRFTHIQHYLSEVNRKLSNLGYFNIADEIYVYSKNVERKLHWKNKGYSRYFVMLFWWLSSRYGVSVRRLFFFSTITLACFGAFYAYIGSTHAFHASNIASHDKLYCNIDSNDFVTCEELSFHPLTYSPNIHGKDIKNIPKKNLFYCDAAIISTMENGFIDQQPTRAKYRIISPEDIVAEEDNNNSSEARCFPGYREDRLKTFIKFLWGTSYAASVFATFSFEDVYPLAWYTILAMLLQLFLGFVLIGIGIALLIRKVSPRF